MEFSRPLYIIVLFYIIGILSAFFFYEIFSLPVFIIFFGIYLFILVFLNKNLLTYLLFLLFFFIGFLNFSYQYFYPMHKSMDYDNRVVDIRGKVLSIDKRSSNMSFILGSFPKVLIRSKNTFDLKNRDEVFLSSVKLHLIDDHNFPSSIRDYYRRKEVFLYGEIGKDNVKSIVSHDLIYSHIVKLRDRLKNIYKRDPFIGALVLGREMDVPAPLKESFIKAGLI
ncbi:MAG TPA: DUF4131 domain-containing protein, partial [Candidatus Atribacteria bacterium]|nr:DUF4131 domain-containing protein [Candidatus Atribacteria bacterium]